MHQEIKSFAANAPDMSVLEMAILLEIANRPGQSIADIRDAFSISQQCAHFHVHRLALGVRDRGGMDLVSVTQDKADRRMRRLKLTSSGRKLAKLLNGSEIQEPTKKRCDQTMDWVGKATKPTRKKKPAKSLFED